MSQLQKTNQTLDFFCDFNKISANVSQVEMSLNTLNYLIGKEDLSKAVEEVWARDPKAFEVMGILIAVREEGNKPVVDSQGNVVMLKSYFSSPKKVVEFLFETGLADVFNTRRIKNLVDYVFGIETGMDTNARKNRSGQIMENEISSILKANGIPYSSQVKSITFPDLKDKLGKDVKKFDFSIRTTRKTYLLEVNFYNGGGSKPNEVARAYTGIAPKINSNPKYEFVWITDGQGWFDAKPEIKAAYDVIPSIYNLTSLPNFLKKIKDEGFVTDSLF